MAETLALLAALSFRADNGVVPAVVVLVAAVTGVIILAVAQPERS